MLSLFCVIIITVNYCNMFSALLILVINYWIFIVFSFVSNTLVHVINHLNKYTKLDFILICFFFKVNLIKTAIHCHQLAGACFRHTRKLVRDLIILNP